MENKKQSPLALIVSQQFIAPIVFSGDSNGNVVNGNAFQFEFLSSICFPRIILWLYSAHLAKVMAYMQVMTYDWHESRKLGEI